MSEVDNVVRDEDIQLLEELNTLLKEDNLKWHIQKLKMMKEN